MAVANQNSPTTENGHVIMMDPNLVNVNTSMTNSIPQYQDMYIFAELTAISKDRTILATSSKGNTTIQENNTAKYRGITVNFIGNNQDKENPNPNYLNFTTNWYDGSSGDRTQFEGFGITNIKVVINSSFVPQVNIEFVDIRGLAFFNQADSPYRILFDFPPPIFNLKLKGYYGMPLQYKLHLVKYTSEFRSENGNFVINAQFIALTYAPLTDVLFSYVVNFPLMPLMSNANSPNGKIIPINPNSTQPPKSTFELILKLKNLYTDYHENPDTATATKEYTRILTNLDSVNETINILNGYKVDDGLIKFDKPTLVVQNNSYESDGGQELTLLNNVFEYDDYIKLFPTDGSPTNINKRLLITYLISSQVYIPLKNTVSLDDDVNWKRDEGLAALEAYKNNVLLKKAIANLGSVIKESDIPIPDENGFYVSPNAATDNPEMKDWYIALDVTNYYVVLYKRRTELMKTKVTVMNALNEKINAMVMDALGMKPTIYSIFKLILDDVDIFFNQLRITSDLAEKHHKEHIDKIVDNPLYQDTGKKGAVSKQIFAFPLVIKQDVVCNKTSESRTAPTQLGISISSEFPEITLVKNFINTFTRQQIIREQLNLKGVQNADGTFKWIPIGPADSIFGTPSLNTPYYGVDNSNGGSSSQPINLSTDTRYVQVFRVLLNRFYILSQNSFPKSFYDNALGAKALIQMFSHSESLNLAVSTTNEEYRNLLSTAGKFYGTEGNINAFYDYIKTNIPDAYTFNEVDTPYLKISNGNDMYTSRKKIDYKGFIIYPKAISIQDKNGDINPVSNFQKTVNLSWWKILGNGGPIPLNNYEFTQENVLYLQDVNPIGSAANNEGVSTESRFIGNLEYISTYPIDGKNAFTRNPVQPEDYEIRFSSEIYERHNRIKLINEISGGLGNAGLSPAVPLAKEMKSLGNAVNVWIDQLSKRDTEIYSTIINPTTTTSRLSALLLLSNFGYTLSPFNLFPRNLNNLVFTTPAAIQVPSYLPAYIGALVDVVPGTQDYNDIYNFFVSGSGKNLQSSGIYIFADLLDVNRYLSDTDKANFRRAFIDFYGAGEANTPFDNIIAFLKLAYNEANPSGVEITEKSKITAYRKCLNSGNGTLFKEILGNYLLVDTNLVNFSEITFKSKPITDDAIGYKSLSTTNVGTTQPFNDIYFKEFFKQLVIDIQKQQTIAFNQEEESKKLSGDEDIITQCYYSFKNINDKWLTDPEKSSSGNISAGYPFPLETGIDDAQSLIDSFVFVDRAMNPIGDTIINPEILIELIDNPNVSVFTVISQLLSMNGFEFFPLQNFMSFERQDWENSFIIDTRGDVTPHPAFVCMYIGGSSSYPTGINSGGQFVDDGIDDISTTTALDFRTPTDCEQIPTEDNQVARNKNFKFGQVRAFRVRFGQQNQSMFKDIKIDSKEYPETNESIQILARLAGDNRQQAPPPKGQNLYNLYENRSYRATVMGLGNMMIQPTQYFQLENIPMYNGAYIILTVEHNIEANKMMTSFSGTKILKYPVPRVMQSSAILGFEGGNTNDTNAGTASADEVTMGVGTKSNPTNAQYNSMYEFKIQ